MSVYIGSKKVKELYYGGKKVKEAWYGSKKVYSSGPEEWKAGVRYPTGSFALMQTDKGMTPFYCYVGHVSDYNNAPYRGIDGTNYWAEVVNPTGDKLTHWVGGVYYNVGDRVLWHGANMTREYRCIKAHVSEEDKEPYWGLLQDKHWKFVKEL